MNRYAVCCLFVVALLTGCQKDISGLYLATDGSGVMWLQLVRTPDNHLSGQISSSILQSDGKIERKTIPVTGAVNGENVTLSGGGLFGLQTLTLSGTLDGSNITFTGLQSAPFVLKRSTLKEYQAEEAKLSARSESALAAKATVASRQRSSEAQRNFVAGVDQLVARMQRFDTQADIHLGRFPNAEKGYEAITAKIGQYVARERQLAGNPNREVERSQLSVAATQASFSTDQLHNQAQALQSSLETEIAPLVTQVTTLEQGCREAGPTRNDLTSVQIEAHQNACNRLLVAAPAFHQKYTAMSTGLSRLEQVYRQEQTNQQRLLHEAEKLE